LPAERKKTPTLQFSAHVGQSAPVVLTSAPARSSWGFSRQAGAFTNRCTS